MQWIAERYFAAGSEWIDAASGRAVHLHLSTPSILEEVDWNEQCARLANLRHPLLNPLIDYGPGPNGCRFEAYERREPLHAPASSDAAEIALRHAAQFLRAHAVTIPAALAPFALRAVIAGRTAMRRPVGLMIQGRRALEALEESLDGLSPAGPATVNLNGAAHAGLRTLRTLAARSARIRGFVPVSPAVISRYPLLLDTLRQRHVCLLDDVDERGRSPAAISKLIAALAAGSARRHVVVRFRRDAAAGVRGIPLEPLSVRSMIGMVFAGGEGDPGEQELFTAARAADGLPGLFVSRLSGAYRVSSRAVVVHESAPEYVVDSLPAPRGPALIAGRVLGSALKARSRAAALAARGRHLAAARLLKRGMRVLEGRERTLDAAECAMQLGWLSLDRGATAGARQFFEQAHRLAADATLAIEASVGLGVAMTDENRLIEAEAVLRGAIAAAETVHDSAAALSAAAALGRCLLWQNRFEEAVAAAAALPHLPDHKAQRVRLLAVLARAHARLRRAGLAVSTAREAQREAAREGSRVQASAELAVAEALGAAGDVEGARAALAHATRMARTHHLPLFRVRAALLTAELSGPASWSRVMTRLRRVALPPLLAYRIQRAATPSPRHLEAVAELETFLEISQRAADDAAATEEICRAVAERLKASSVAIFSNDDRLLAIHGRNWPSIELAARQVIADGAALRPDGRREPQEAAEPMRFGGEIIGALACRWLAGTTVEVHGAATILRAAALAAAPHVRAVLDRATPEPPALWADLIGQSPAAAALRDAAARAARAPFPVLVEGESGCGKELVARAVHRLSPRRERRFCALNCAALTDDLVETELFGHARGAFTGAAGERAGLFEEADGGTLFLDEVGELSARAQAKLLRVLQEGEIRRVGENLPRRVDVRVVAATNRRLEDEVAGGRFRADLRFRLDVVRIPVPPLRERTSDIPLLAAHFWRDASSRVGSRATLSAEALSALARYDWPGNVRELQNVIAWIAVQSPRRGRIGPSALPRHVAQATVATPCTFEAARQEFERRFVRAALAGANGQRTRAAEALGVTRQGLSKMMRRLRIE